MLSWLDKLTMPLAPRWTMRRVHARIAMGLLARNYEAASTGRRTSGWRRSSTDANTSIGSAAKMLREQARDLVENNAHAESALTTIVDHTVGWGIIASPKKGSAKPAPSNVARDVWKAWAETTACDADGRQDFYGLQAQVMRTVVESGECLVRRRWRRPEDKLPLPVQLQVLEPDFLDATKMTSLPNGGKIVQGVEFDAIGRRVGYWMYPDHPGASIFTSLVGGAAQRIPATEILHVFRPGRPGAARAATWFANVILRMKDFDEYEDATLMKQKIAACLAVITSDIDGSAPALGTKDATTQPAGDSLEPGMIINAPAGRTVTVVDPPSVGEYDAYTRVQLRTIAAGLGVTYEDLCGDYTALPFSAARMSRLRHWARIYAWRWRMLIPQFCDPAWAWAMEAAAVMSKMPAAVEERPAATWTAPPPAMIEPDKEGLAYMRLLRLGAITWPEMIRELGYEPDAVFDEVVEWNKKFDAAGVIFDGDPRKTTQQGGSRDTTTGAPPVDPAAATTGNGNSNGNGNGYRRGHEGPLIAAGAFRIESPVTVAAPPPAAVHVDGATINVTPAPITIAEGAVRVDGRTILAKGAIQATTPITVEGPTVEGSTIHVAPPVMTIEEGAVRVDAPVSVTTPPVHVSTPTTIAEGAVRVEVPVSVQSPPMTIADGAVQVRVEAPDINVTPAPITITEGAVRVDVRPAEVTIAEGAVRVEAPPAPSVVVEAPPPAQVMIAEGAVAVTPHIHLPEPPEETIVEKSVTHDAQGRIKGVKETHRAKKPKRG